ncbi:nuclear transport factor 2 family protein [Mesoplasma seiffertii]|uniref:nuclear transport factor 2 family protein n=1 Tax=Mesoplasma seiffertii TaxID=28224 RepID=UPI0006890E1B|nr:nuclear transport factor 2 family protein [Mesoplasma seiffertii]
MGKQEILDSFYTAFKNGDSEKMNSLYSKKVTFNDAIFENLNYKQVTNMWTSLLATKEQSQFVVDFEIKNLNEEIFVVWTATYLFGPKRRKVVNVVESRMTIQDEKIIVHTDSFDFYNWAKQAIGGPAIIFGKQKWFQKKVAAKAMNKLK